MDYVRTPLSFQDLHHLFQDWTMTQSNCLLESDNSYQLKNSYKVVYFGSFYGKFYIKLYWNVFGRRVAQHDFTMMISPFDCRFRCCFERDFASLLHSPYTQLILPSASHSKASWSNNSCRNGVYWVLLHDVAIHHHRLSCSQSICWGDKFVHDFRDFNRKYVEGAVGLLLYVMVSIQYGITFTCTGLLYHEDWYHITIWYLMW